MPRSVVDSTSSGSTATYHRGFRYAEVASLRGGPSSTLAPEEDDTIVGITSPGSSWPPTGPARLRWAATAASVCAATAVLSACGADFGAQTSQVYQAAEGANSRAGDVYVLNTLVVSDGEGGGTVVATLINQADTPDTLAGFSATDADGKAIPAAGQAEPITLDVAPSADQSVQVGTQGSLRLEGRSLVPGTVVDLTFTFAAAAPVVITVPVVAGGPDTIYADIPLGPISTEPTASDGSTTTSTG